MVTNINLGEIDVAVVKKDIKNIHLSVNPPTGDVRISAPLRMNNEAIRLFAISKLDWIKREQNKLLGQKREIPRQFIDRESHYVWGKRYLMEVIEVEAPPLVKLKHSKMVLQVRPGANEEKKRRVVEEWYRAQIKEVTLSVISKWETRMGVEVERFFVQKMKTKWGSCNPEAKRIRLNTDLAKKKQDCLEYIIVHEMAHLLVPGHGDRFVALMDQHLPSWRHLQQTLNASPLAHANWDY
jgi:predicted metal-dependent hydrolase